MKDYLPDVVVAVAEELSKNVDGHDTEAAVCLDIEDCEYRFIQYRIPDILRRVGVSSNLQE